MIWALKSSEGSLPYFLSLPPSLSLSVFPVFFCVPGPGLLTLASSCVVLLPEGTVLGSTNSSNSWGGKSGINGRVVGVGVKKFIFIELFLYPFIFKHNLKCHPEASAKTCFVSAKMLKGVITLPVFQIVNVILQIKPSCSNYATTFSCRF